MKLQPLKVHAMKCGVKRQNGAVLVMCLVLLLVITLISIAGLSGASDQVRMVNNAQQINTTFQTADSAMSQAITLIDGQPLGGIEGNSQILAAVIDAGINVPVVINSEQLSDDSISVYVTYTHQKNSALMTGVSLNADENTTLISRQQFIIQGSAIIESSGAHSTLRKGISYE